ncbi:YetF domain-containing protein, partial [Neobacillus drentensis]
MMDFFDDLPTLPYIFKALLIFLAAIMLLRIAGKRSLAETTVSEAVLRISIGAVLIQPLALKNEWEAIYAGSLLIIGVVLLAKIQIWIPKSRKFINGVPSVLINDGQMKLEVLKKARLTTDE